MTELEALQALQSALSGPSLRWDAEAELKARGWPELAIRLAKREPIAPAEGLKDAPHKRLEWHDGTHPWLHFAGMPFQSDGTEPAGKLCASCGWPVGDICWACA